MLARVASMFHPQMLVVQAAAYESWQTTALQRASVIACDVVMFACACALRDRLATMSAAANASHSPRKHHPPPPARSGDAVAFIALVSLHAGPVIVDSIHFQYQRALCPLALRVRHVSPACSALPRYNSIATGLLYLTARSLLHRQPVLATLFYSVCVCFKHINACAPRPRIRQHALR